jgi:hypothetical protein
MSNYKSDMLIGLIFIAGTLSFISGEFVISTFLIASAAIYSNIVTRSHIKG